MSAPAWAYEVADQIIQDVRRGGDTARELIASRLMLVHATGEYQGMVEARETVATAPRRPQC